MICWVVECVLAARTVSQVIVATDDVRILDAVRAGGHDAVLTKGDHASGTDRLAEVARSLADDVQVIVNVQETNH